MNKNYLVNKFNKKGIYLTNVLRGSKRIKKCIFIKYISLLSKNVCVPVRNAQILLILLVNVHTQKKILPYLEKSVSI